MKVANIKDFVNGWFVGDFEPSIFKTKDFEVSVKSHKKGEETLPHYHSSSDEINLIINGRLCVNGQNLKKGNFFIYERNDVSDVEFLTDALLLIVRIPSAPNDKVLIDV